MHFLESQQKTRMFFRKKEFLLQEQLKLIGKQRLLQVYGAGQELRKGVHYFNSHLLLVNNLLLLSLRHLNPQFFFQCPSKPLHSRTAFLDLFARFGLISQEPHLRINNVEEYEAPLANQQQSLTLQVAAQLSKIDTTKAFNSHSFSITLYVCIIQGSPFSLTPKQQICVFKLYQ